MVARAYTYKNLEIKDTELKNVPEITDTELTFKQQLEIMEQWELGQIEPIRSSRLSTRTVKTDIGLMSSLYNKMAGVTLDRSWINTAIKKLQDEGITDRSIYAYEFAMERFFRANLKDPNFKIIKHKYIVPESKYHTLPEILSIINGCKNIRDRAILATLYYASPRASELCNMKISDLDLNNKLIIINSTKQHRQRTIPLAKEAIPYLQQWVDVRAKILSERNLQSDYLFINQMNGQFTIAGILNLTVKHADRVGIKSHPHLFRHSRVNHLLYIYHWPIDLVAKFVGDTIDVVYTTYAHTSTQDLQRQMNISDQMKMQKLGGI
jgi:integrase